MMQNSKLVEPKFANHSDLDPYQEMAIHVRKLLRCDYALVATAESDGVRVRAISGNQPEKPGNHLSSTISKLGDWGPMVVDDARLVAVPVTEGEHVLGLLVGFCAQPGQFTETHLEKLLSYSHVAVGIMAGARLENGADRANLSAPELLHFSRLVTIGELSACFAHEVTNPLTLIRGHLRFVEESLPRDHPLRMNFEIIDRSSRRIEEMAKRMLDFSRKKLPRSEPCDIADVISEALRFIQPYFRLQNIDVQVKLDQNLPVADIDPGQLVQAIVNLFQNAADAMSESEKRSLSIVARNEGDTLRIAVTDTGKGIAPENLTHIFEPFFTTKGELGTGLGLYITRQVIEGHGGALDVQTGDRGTTFVISLPL